MFYFFTRFLRPFSGQLYQEQQMTQPTMTSLEWLVVCYYTTAVSAKQNNRVSCSRSSNRKGQQPKKIFTFIYTLLKTIFETLFLHQHFKISHAHSQKYFQVQSFLYFFSKIGGGSFHNWLKPRLVQKMHAVAWSRPMQKRRR